MICGSRFARTHSGHTRFAGLSTVVAQNIPWHVDAVAAARFGYMDNSSPKVLRRYSSRCRCQCNCSVASSSNVRDIRDQYIAYAVRLSTGYSSCSVCCNHQE